MIVAEDARGGHQTVNRKLTEDPCAEYFLDDYLQFEATDHQSMRACSVLSWWSFWDSHLPGLEKPCTITRI